MSHEFSIWSSYDFELTPEEMVLAMEKRDLHVCEFSDEHGAVLLERGDDEIAIGKAFRAFGEEHHLRFPQGHLWLTVRLCDPKKDVIGILSRWIRLFSSIGIRNAVLHCDFYSFPEGTDAETILDANAEVLKKLLPTAEEYNVRICLENTDGLFCDIEPLLAVIERAGGSDALGICLDTGHLNIFSKETQKHFITTAGKRLHALHIADNEGQRDQHLMPFCRGTVNFKDVMEGLREVGYSDLFNYEIPGERLAPVFVRDAKAEYLKTVTEALYRL